MQFYREEKKQLFGKHDLQQRLDEDIKETPQAADKMPSEKLAAHSNEMLAQEIVAEHVLSPLNLDTGGLYARQREIQIAECQGGGTVVVLDVHIPFQGHTALLHSAPRNRPRAAVYGETTESEVVLTFLTGQSPERLKQDIDGQVTLVREWVAAINSDIAVATRQIKEVVLSRLARRRRRLSQSGALLAALDIPIKKVPPTEALEIPIIRRPVAPQKVAHGSAGQDEWRLSRTVYEQIVDTIIRFAHALERRPLSAQGLIPDEPTLRDWMNFMLNANYEHESGEEIFVAGEAINGKGKTDILVRHQGRNAFIGECKFWKGEEEFNKAIDQLLGYLVWRDTKAAIILFIKNKNASAVIETADACIRRRQCKPATLSDQPARRRDYTLASPHDADQMISLALIPVVVTTPA
ncbi:hypothetical protein [Amycolatopsis sp. cmx-4-54]|uniref:hypothetical protein n=1 Tax=Amycolatopsis sp. cmx-4-54 TaxID=2790936 RepID=UPI00397DBAA7